MSDYKLTREEQETVILGNAASQKWEVVTADPRIIRKMAKQGYQPDDRPNPWGYVSFTVPLDRIKIGKAVKRTLSEEHRKKLLNARSSLTALSIE
jgi:hypothetical protein